MDIETLKQRISNGRKWLMTHTNHPKYAKALRLYESLVKEAKKHGLTEEECWTVDSLEDYEIVSIFKS